MHNLTKTFVTISCAMLIIAFIGGCATSKKPKLTVAPAYSSNEIDELFEASDLNKKGLILCKQGQYAKAEPLYQRALTIREKVLGAEHPATALSLKNLAELYDAQVQYAKDLDRIRQANNILRQRLLNAAESRSAAAGGEVKELKNAGTFLLHLKLLNTKPIQEANNAAILTTEGFEISQLQHDGNVGAALAQMAARYAAGAGPVADLIRLKQDTLLAWQKTDANLIAALSKPKEQRNSELETNLREQSQKLTQELTAIDQPLNREFPAYAELALLEPLTIQKAQRLLAPEEALLAWVFGENKDDGYVWLVRQNMATMRRIPMNAAQLSQRVEKLRQTLSPDSNPGLNTAFPVTEAHSLYTELMGQEAANLNDIKTLFVVSDGALEQLPLAVLVTNPAPTNPQDYTKVAWLSRKWATDTLPTASSLCALRDFAIASQVTRPLVAGPVEKFQLGKIEPTIALTPPQVATLQRD
jgi:DNA-binding phage protein